MSQIIFVSGVTGYIGSQTLVLCLEAGYNVRAAIRKESQIEKLSNHKRIKPYIQQVTFIVIPDLTDLEVLVENLKNVTGVLHLASPLPSHRESVKSEKADTLSTAQQTTEYDRDIIQPALSITSAILHAAKLTPSISRVIITSSAVTLIPFTWLFSPDTEEIYTSDSLNTSTSGPFTSAMEAYWASKALSRAAVHDFLSTESPHFEIIQLLPSVVIGPDMLAETKQDVLTGTRALALAPLLGQDVPTPLVGTPIHVLDVARAHVDALSASVPGNKDYVLSSDAPDGIEWNEVLEIAERYFPDAIEKGLLKMGGNMGTTRYRIGTEETERAFGWKATSFEKTIVELVELYVELPEKSIV